jgi:hypothetical protein
MKEKEKVMIEIINTQTEDAVVLAKEITAEEDAVDVEESAVDAVEEETIVSIYRMSNALIVAKRAIVLLTAHSQENMTMNSQHMVSKSDFKNLFQSSLKEMLTKKDKHANKKEKH